MSRAFTSGHACERARSQVSLRLDGELSQFEEAKLRVHLVHCPACRAYQTDLVAFTSELRSAALEPLERPIALPRRRHVSLSQLQVGVAAFLVAAVGLGSALGVVRAERFSSPTFQVSESPFVASESRRFSRSESSDSTDRAIARVKNETGRQFVRHGKIAL